MLLPRGGIPPAARRRSRLPLTPAEREDISRGIASGLPMRKLAAKHKLRNIAASKLVLALVARADFRVAEEPPSQQTRTCACRTRRLTAACFIQARGVLKKDLMDHLRSKRRMRRSHHFNPAFPLLFAIFILSGFGFGTVVTRLKYSAGGDRNLQFAIFPRLVRLAMRPNTFCMLRTVVGPTTLPVRRMRLYPKRVCWHLPQETTLAS